MKYNYFVTGATGAVGSALVQRLLREPDAKIWALIRAKSEQHLAERLLELNNYWNFGNDTLKRVIPLSGDVTRKHFGLPDEAYEQLINNVTHIFHCAGVVRMNLPMAEARLHAVGSAEQILQLGRSALDRGKLKKIEFVSTVGVGGKMSGPVPENWITEKREFHNTYEASKAEAEDLLQTTMKQRQLPLTIHRPSMVVGDSRDGRIIHFQIFYYLCEFISGGQTKGLLPDLSDAKLDTVPVDYVADVLYWSSGTENTSGRILHLSSGPEHSIELGQLQALVRSHFGNSGIRLPTVIALPNKIFKLLAAGGAKLFPADKRRKMAAVPIFLEYLSDRQIFTNNRTIELLREYNGSSLPLPYDYLPTALDRYLAQRSA